MPVPRNTPLDKRRVKTGCVACRQRRRKCDEKKPQCTNCEARRSVCKYPSAPDPQSGTYAEITFVEDCRSPVKSPPKVAARSAPWARPSSNITGSSVSWHQPTPRPMIHHQVPASWGSYFDTDLTESSQREIALLRQFRYRTAPWLEAGDPDSQFGVAMMRMAQEHEPIRALVTDLASSQLLHRLDSARMHDTRAQLSKDAPELDPVADALMSLTAILSAGPVAWKQFLFQHGQSNVAMYDMGEPLQTLTNQESRIDLAASILVCRPPATGQDYYLAQRPVSGRVSTFFPAYKWALCHLTSCLHFVFWTPSASPIAARVSSGSPGTIPRPVAPPSWHDLWLRTQTWYDTRPVEMQSLVEIGSIEISQIDPASSASFPIHLYSSAIAVQAATFYHMTALLLLQHKPRLLNIPGRRQHLTSPNWHVRAIAGVATSNEFPDQWDPIVIASLLYIAKDITHSAQQHAILECLHNVSAQTGIPLEEEAKQLCTQWSDASLVEGPVSR